MCVCARIWKPEVIWYLPQLLSTVFSETVSLSKLRVCHLDEADCLAGLPISPNVCLSSTVIIGRHHC